MAPARFTIQYVKAGRRVVGPGALETFAARIVARRRSDQAWAAFEVYRGRHGAVWHSARVRLSFRGSGVARVARVRWHLPRALAWGRYTVRVALYTAARAPRPLASRTAPFSVGRLHVRPGARMAWRITHAHGHRIVEWISG